MVNSLENIDKSKVYVDRIEGLDEVVEGVVDNTLVGAVSTITKSDLTAGKVLVSDNNGKVAAGSKGISDLQDALISGTNIKTINNISILGSGNINVESGADTSLSNLTTQGQNIANWSSNVTNCITEIPQDIKLELNNGTLTLKAGSKVYVPNGVGVFDVVDITSDKTLTYNMDGSFLIFVNPTSKYMYIIQKTNCISGSSRSLVSTWSCWYDTTNNVINHYTTDSSIVTDIATFPIAEVTVSNNAISSIDQVFNGFGYIGSTVFVLPGVKGLIPDGRNKDGTLKNIEFTTSSVLTSTQAFTGWNGKWSLYLNASSIGYHPTELEYISDTKPTGVYTTTAYWYSPLDNKLYFTQDIGATWTQSTELHCIDYTENSSKITSITPKTAFHAVDYNDFADLKDNVDTINSNAIHKTGDETISGVKIFTGDGWITKIQNTNVTYNIAPSSAKGTTIVFTDKNGTQMGCVESMRFPSNNTSVKLNVYSPNGNWASQALELMIDANGNVSAFAPTPDVSSNGTNIATTAFVNTKFQVVSTLPANPNGNVYYFIPE